MNILKRYLSYRANRRRRSRDSFIDSLFVLEERAGQMWLTCDGHAVLAFPEDSLSEDMLGAAQNMRIVAKSFDRHVCVNMCDNEDSDNPDPIVLNVTGYKH